MPRRIPDFPDSFHSWNFLSSIGSGITFLSFAIFLKVVYKFIYELFTGMVFCWSARFLSSFRFLGDELVSIFLAGARASACVLASCINSSCKRRTPERKMRDQPWIMKKTARHFLCWRPVFYWPVVHSLDPRASACLSFHSRLLALLFTFCAAAKGQVERTTRRLLLSSIVNQERRVPVT